MSSMRTFLFLFLLAIISTISSFSDVNAKKLTSNDYEATVKEQRQAANTLRSPTMTGRVKRANYADLPKVRTKRGAFWDFLQKVGTTANLAVDQFVDTKNTFSRVYNLLNEGFSDPPPAKPTLRPPPQEEKSEETSNEVTTTTEKYEISRYQFGRILGYNFRGLQRLMKIELQAAQNATKNNIQEYQAEARKQFANSVALEKKDQLLRQKG